MAGITLYDYQKDALERMKIGCILWRLYAEYDKEDEKCAD